MYTLIFDDYVEHNPPHHRRLSANTLPRCQFVSLKFRKSVRQWDLSLDRDTANFRVLKHVCSFFPCPTHHIRHHIFTSLASKGSEVSSSLEKRKWSSPLQLPCWCHLVPLAHFKLLHLSERSQVLTQLLWIHSETTKSKHHNLNKQLCTTEHNDKENTHATVELVSTLIYRSRTNYK